MKSDIDRLMKDANLDGLLVIGPAGHNPYMTYFTGLVHVTRGYLLKKRDHSPVLFHGSMERDEAASTGLQIKNLDDYDPLKLLEEAGGDPIQASAMLLQRIFKEFDVRGRVGLYGKTEIGPHYATLRLVGEALPDVELVGEASSRSVLTRARTTKDEDEVARIRKVGEITSTVVADVAGFLTSHQVKDGVLVDRQGEALTVGEVKRRINLWLAMRGAENPEGTIFAIGRDAGVPHSAGADDDLIPIGKPIVFDIYPCEAGGGYFHDFTRTWCLGYAPDEVQQVYEDVLDVFETVYQALKPNTPCRDYQVMTCELFEEKGHPTVLNNPKTKEGYVHSLAHGVGLAVHEGPYFSHVESNKDQLLPGSVITHEPGLYYPDRELGVRIEDTVWVHPDGTLEILAEYSKDLVLKM
ncbi:MAG: aminopeptidase P family protein [Anaerolineales bacterium]|nr:MAG: aminopeptidase P family protein [Anaerolineales bacterium]